MLKSQVPLEEILCIIFGLDSFVPYRGYAIVYQTVELVTGTPYRHIDKDAVRRCADALRALEPRLSDVPPPPSGADRRQLDNWLHVYEAWLGTTLEVRPTSLVPSGVADTRITIYPDHSNRSLPYDCY